MATNPYENEGFENRNDYLNGMAEAYRINPTMVHAMADLLGETEDFDGLVTHLQDMEGAEDLEF